MLAFPMRGRGHSHRETDIVICKIMEAISDRKVQHLQLVDYVLLVVSNKLKAPFQFNKASLHIESICLAGTK